MASPPTKQMILQLYHATLKTSKTFSSYNFRNYFVDRTKDVFRDIQKENDPARLTTMYGDAVKELTVLRRSAILNQIYGGWKLAVEETPKKPEDILQRGDT
ncbi:hypothetical protein CYLTODRAFT_362261 [Cylindrobasidium torrendii FP15055 ss-10]|uniref:Complex 1 LYR protein domain-containing protein n=1 Tax=Cylindrobasidium torrendii FP15055 ss-10 TaxID=1314674 RepID=A0A0D7AV41_9AGAR|nr:hypothetical protein CYLTODRAFT_362261 [Cylindrobasidium torrendii FP15055 ss-10]